MEKHLSVLGCSAASSAASITPTVPHSDNKLKSPAVPTRNACCVQNAANRLGLLGNI